MIEAAREIERPNLSFERIDIERLEFKEAFDVVFSNAALHWVQDHRSMLLRVHRALASGGALRFNFGAEGNCPTLIRGVREVMDRKMFAPSFRDFNWPWFMPGADEYRRLIRTAGFSDAEIWTTEAPRTFPNAESFIGWIEQPSLVPFLVPLENGQRRPFRDQVVSSMLESARRSDGTFFEAFSRLNVRARK